MVPWLRQRLLRLGPYLDPVNPDLGPGGLDGFPDRCDAAIVALLQAQTLLGLDDFVYRLAEAGHVSETSSDPTAKLMALGRMSQRIERLFHELAWRLDPQLHQSGTLTESLLEFKRRHILPLDPNEVAAWDEDQAWVGAQRKEKRTLLKRKKSVVPLLWAQRIEERLADQGSERRVPRYHALLELQRLRNAAAHGRTSAFQGMAPPHRVWGRMLGLVAMVCVKAFSHGALRPAPVWEVGATTISRGPARQTPPREATQELVAVATVESEEAPPPTPPRRRLVPLLVVSTLAVIVGTVAANVVAPRPVATAVREAPDDVPLEELESATPNAIAEAAEQLSFVPGGVAMEPAATSSWCRDLADGADTSSGDLPGLVFQRGQGRELPAGPLSVAELGRILAHRSELGSSVVLEASASRTRDAAVNALAAEVCHERPVLRLSEVVGIDPLPDAFIIATLDGTGGVAQLRRLAASGRTPRMLVVTEPGGGEGLPDGPEVRFDSLSCPQARAAILRETAESRVRMRLRQWIELDGSANCAPLEDLEGVRLVSQVVARHPRPPARFAGTWHDWVGLALERDRSRGGRVPRVAKAPVQPHGGEAAGLEEQRRVHGTARLLAAQADIPDAGAGRRRGCRAWVELPDVRGGLGDPNLVAHLVGTDPGRACLSYLVDGALGAGLGGTELQAVVSRGLGSHPERADVLRQAQSDPNRGRRVVGPLLRRME